MLDIITSLGDSTGPDDHFVPWPSLGVSRNKFGIRPVINDPYFNHTWCDCRVLHVGKPSTSDRPSERYQAESATTARPRPTINSVAQTSLDTIWMAKLSPTNYIVTDYGYGLH